jgi:hypothetical protein
MWLLAKKNATSTKAALKLHRDVLLERYQMVVHYLGCRVSASFI